MCRESQISSILWGLCDGRIAIWKWFLWREENQDSPEKNPHSKTKNQQQTHRAGIEPLSHWCKGVN